ncbi:MAG: CocE/NonD family hydrolase [Pseudomonadota bacterium]
MDRNSRRTAFTVVLLAQLAACTSVTTLPAGYKAPGALPADYLRAFCYTPLPTDGTLELVKEKKRYRVFEGSITAGIESGSSDNDGDTPITFEYYEQPTDAPVPVILLLPILNGQKHLMRPFATTFAKRGYAVIIIDTVQRRTLLDDLKDPEPAIRQAVQRHRRVIDWVEAQPGLDVSRLGLFGASLGGFNALFLAALDERVTAASIALVGGSLPDVLVSSNERRIVEAVTGVKAELGLDDDQLRDYLDARIQTDTLKLARHVNAEQVQMILAKFDKAVPYASQRELHDAMGQPQSVTLPTGHVTAAAYLPALRSGVRDFLDGKLGDAAAGSKARVATATRALCSGNAEGEH